MPWNIVLGSGLKTEGVDDNALSAWVKAIRHLVKRRVYFVYVLLCLQSVFENMEIAATLADIQDKYVVVPADKSSNNVVFVCKNNITNV